MITEYERYLTEKDKKALRKEIAFAESLLTQTRKFAILRILGFILFALIIYAYPMTWLMVILSIISFFMIWMLILEIKDLIKVPKHLSSKRYVIDTGIVQVREFKIDRYIKIKSYGDEGDYFILEHKGHLTMVGGQDFDGVRKLKNKIEYIDIMDSGKNGYYHTRVDKSGNSLEPLLEFKGKLPDELINSELWNCLTKQLPFEGRLEELMPYIKEQQRK